MFQLSGFHSKPIGFRVRVCFCFSPSASDSLEFLLFPTRVADGIGLGSRDVSGLLRVVARIALGV